MLEKDILGTWICYKMRMGSKEQLKEKNDTSKWTFREDGYLSYEFINGSQAKPDPISRRWKVRLAMELGFQTGDHDFQISTPTEALGGNVSLTFINLNLKYYLNTQNVTRGLADLNPYVLGGFSQVYRTYTITDGDVSSREATVGVNGGLGIEIPILRRKAYFGAQATYHYVNFRDENANLVNFRTGTDFGVKPKGDTFDVVGILGMSF